MLFVNFWLEIKARNAGGPGDCFTPSGLAVTVWGPGFAVTEGDVARSDQMVKNGGFKTMDYHE